MFNKKKLKEKIRVQNSKAKAKMHTQHNKYTA